VTADTRPILLLPPSKGKAPDGDGPPYPSQLDRDAGLAGPRQAVLDAIANDLDGLDDRALTRVAGVRAVDVPTARHELSSLATAATFPAHRRYAGIVHGNAGLAELDPAEVAVDVRIVSALAGLVDLAQPLPPYRLEFGASLPSLGGIGTWWRGQAADHLADVVAGRRVFDLLPAEHARIWDPSVRREADVVTFAFLRPDGRAANAARTKVCKGRLAAYLLAHPDVEVGALLERADPGAGWRLTADVDADGEGVRATFHG
jgi:cytoplasmic iron level regulating protein YaaA (DUF328/UPF0246 family)